MGICTFRLVINSSDVQLRGRLLPAATKLGQGNIFTGVCLSTGGVCLSACWDIPPREQTPPGSRHPPGPDTRPGSRLQHTVNERPVRILLECILVYNGLFPCFAVIPSEHLS